MALIDNVEEALETSPYLDACWKYDSAPSPTYTSYTKYAKVGTDFSMILESGDYFYFGHCNKMELLMFILTTAGSYGALTWEFSSNGSWVTIVPEENCDFTISGPERFVRVPNWTPMCFSGTAPHTATPPDTSYRYWLRVSAASQVTAAVIHQIECNPICRYTNPTRVYELLQLTGGDFTATSTPTREQVKQFIRRAESRIDFESRKSWKYNLVKYEEHEFSRFGIRLNNFPIKKLLKLEIWSGNDWENYTIASRTDEAFSIDTMGMVYFSRFFILPARLAMSGAFWRWGYGEFSFPVRFTYIYGRDIDTDYQGGMVSNIATKLAAIDVALSSDYTVILSSGVEHVRVQDKIEKWERECDENIERLQSFMCI